MVVHVAVHAYVAMDDDLALMEAVVHYIDEDDAVLVVADIVMDHVVVVEAVPGHNLDDDHMVPVHMCLDLDLTFDGLDTVHDVDDHDVNADAESSWDAVADMDERQKDLAVVAVAYREMATRFQVRVNHLVNVLVYSIAYLV